MLTSSFIRPRSSNAPVIHTVPTPNANASGIGGKPARYASVTPANAAWAVPAPMKAKPRRTTKTPMTAHRPPVSDAASRAR